MSQRSPFTNLMQPLNAFGGSLRTELTGAVIAALGIFLAFIVLRYDAASTAAPPFVIMLAGWTALPLAITLIVLGMVLLLGRRAGYWSAEALVGAEVMLLALPTISYLLAYDAVEWSARLDGENGGLIGWALGNLLMAAMGHSLAMLVAWVVALLGLIMLVRFTPLIYVAVALGRWLPVLPAIGRKLGRFLRIDRDVPMGYPPLPHTPNFVLPASAEIQQTRNNSPAAFVPAAVPASMVHAERAKALPVTPGKWSAVTVEQAPATKKSQPPPVAAAPRPGRSACAPAVDRPARRRHGHLYQHERHPSRTDPAQDIGRLQCAGAHHPCGERPHGHPVWRGATLCRASGQKRKVRVNRIVSLSNDLALALAAPAVRIEAPVPGRPYVGIEVPKPEQVAGQPARHCGKPRDAQRAARWCCRWGAIQPGIPW